MSILHKKISKSGAISVPVRLRREMGVMPGDPLEIELKDGKLNMKPYILRCILCGTTANVVSLKGKGLCKECAEKAMKGEIQSDGNENE